MHTAMASETLVQVPANKATILVSRGLASRFNDLGATLTVQGLHLSRQLTMDELLDLGDALLEASQATDNPLKFCIGDWANTLERQAGRNGSRAKGSWQGDEIGGLCKKHGIHRDTVRGFAWVASQIKPVLRGTGLSWSAYKEMAAEPEDVKREWFTLAEKAPGSITVKSITLGRTIREEKNRREEEAQQKLETELTKPVELPTTNIQADQDSLIASDEANGIEYHQSEPAANHNPAIKPFQVPAGMEAGVDALIKHQGGIPKFGNPLQEVHELIDKIGPQLIKKAEAQGTTPKTLVSRALQTLFDP